MNQSPIKVQGQSRSTSKNGQLSKKAGHFFYKKPILENEEECQH